MFRSWFLTIILVRIEAYVVRLALQQTEMLKLNNGNKTKKEVTYEISGLSQC